jgi:hypothetical protein
MLLIINKQNLFNAMNKPSEKNTLKLDALTTVVIIVTILLVPLLLAGFFSH